MRKLIFASLILLCTLTQLGAYERSDFEILSPALDNSKVPVFVLRSKELDPESDVEFVLFLHGRGYARKMNVQGSMLEHLGIQKLLKKYPQTIFIAPQDIFYHEDSHSIGQDYWIGAKNRDWTSFLGEELPLFVDAYKTDNGLRGNFKTILGISMGAHGSLFTAQKYPEQFPVSIALSPVFRPVEAEMPKEDLDVFLKSPELGIEAYNLGARVLSGIYSLPQRTYISISEADFGLDEEKFPRALDCWQALLTSKASKDFIEINPDPSGHSAIFWGKQLPIALDWAFKQQ